MRKAILLIIFMVAALLVTGCGVTTSDTYYEYGTGGSEQFAAPYYNYTDEFEPAEELTSEEIRELLESIPYPGMVVIRPQDWVIEEMLRVVNTETAAELASFIYGMNWWLLPPLLESFNSPEEAEQRFVLSRALVATRNVQWRYSEKPAYFPKLIAIEPYIKVPWDGVTLHSHLETSAAQLFGVEFEVDPYALVTGWNHTYNIHGVYVHDQGGIGTATIRVPIILSYEYIGGGYEVVCVFLGLFLGEEEDVWLAGGDDMTSDEMLEYLRTTQRRHTITLRNNPNGGFYYWAHILPAD